MNQVKSDIIKKIAELGELDVSEVRAERTLKELGIDSLMAIELVVFIEKMIHRPIPEDRMGSIRTCGDVFQEVESLLESPAPG